MKGVIPWQSTPLKKDNRLYWPAYFYDTLSPSPNINQLVVLELDTNYNHVALHKINNRRYFSGTAPSQTSLVYVSGRFYVNQLYTSGDTSIIYKLNSQFLKIDSITIKGRIQQMQTVDNKLLLNASGLPAPCYDPWFSSVLKLEMDTSYNIVSCFSFTNVGSHNYAPVPQPIRLQQVTGTTSIFALSKTKTLAVGGMSVWHTLQPPSAVIKLGIVNCIISETNAVINAAVYSNSVSNFNYTNGPNVVAVKNNEIVTVGCIGFNDQMNIINQTGNSSIFVNKIDTLGNLIWQREFFADYFHVPTGITFTFDGGYLISGWRYPKKQGSTAPLVESFLLKLDSNGSDQPMTLSEEDHLGEFQNIMCYPVPASDNIYFSIQNHQQIVVEIYNTLGQIIIKEDDYQHLQEINISGLDRDFYFYTIRSKTKNYSGKFVKE